MLVNTRVIAPYTARGEIICTHRAVWVVIKQRIANGTKCICRQNPVRNLVMDILRVHIVDILRVVCPANKFLQAGELAGLRHNGAEVSPIADPEKLSVRHVGPIFNHGSHRPHSGIALAACLAFDHPCQKLSGCIRHKKHASFFIDCFL